VPFGPHVVNVAMHNSSLAVETPLVSRHSVTGCYLSMDVLFEGGNNPNAGLSQTLHMLQVIFSARAFVG
jgi:hypothetical protein